MFGGHWIWKLNIFPRIQTFLWMCCHNSIAVRECIAKKGMIVPLECPICTSNPESIIHALRDCSFEKLCWNKLGFTNEFPKFFIGYLCSWFRSFSQTNKVIQHPAVHWSTVSCLVYGHYGSTERRWFFNIKPTLLPSMKRLCTGQLNAATVLRNLKLQLLGFLFKSDGRNLNKIGTSLTLMELLWEIRVYQEVVVL